MKEYKVVVLGPGGVGKSALTVQFCHSKFVEKYDPTIEVSKYYQKKKSNRFFLPLSFQDFYRKEIEVDGEPAYLEILDTAGQFLLRKFLKKNFSLGTEQFASMRDLYIKNGRGFLVVFSLTSWQSFLDIRNVREQILRVKGTDNVPICLIGNKCDASLQRQVTPDDALALAQSWSCPYIETSAKLTINVNDTFAEIVREINSKIKIKRIKKKKKKYKKKSFFSCCL